MYPHNRPFETNNRYAQFGAMQPLAKGITGHIIEQGDTVIIPFFMSEVEGRGYAGQFIDGLKDKYKIVMIPNLLSDKLEQMLLRRGFKKKWKYVDFLKSHTDVMIWKK